MALPTPDPDEFMSREIAMEYLARLLYLVTTRNNDLRVTRFHAIARRGGRPNGNADTGMQLTLRWDNISACVPHLEGRVGMGDQVQSYRLATGQRRADLRECAKRIMLDAYAAAETGEGRITLTRIEHREGWEGVATDLIHEGYLDAALKLIFEYIDLDKLLDAIVSRAESSNDARDRLRAWLDVLPDFLAEKG